MKTTRKAPDRIQRDQLADGMPECRGAALAERRVGVLENAGDVERGLAVAYEIDFRRLALGAKQGETELADVLAQAALRPPAEKPLPRRGEVADDVLISLSEKSSVSPSSASRPRLTGLKRERSAVACRVQPDTGAGVFDLRIIRRRPSQNAAWLRAWSSVFPTRMLNVIRAKSSRNVSVRDEACPDKIGEVLVRRMRGHAFVETQERRAETTARRVQPASTSSRSKRPIGGHPCPSYAPAARATSRRMAASRMATNSALMTPYVSVEEENLATSREEALWSRAPDRAVLRLPSGWSGRPRSTRSAACRRSSSEASLRGSTPTVRSGSRAPRSCRTPTGA